MPLKRSTLAVALPWGVPVGLWAFMLYFTSAYASNVPFWDEWDYTELIAGLKPVNFEVIWAQHNEHRILWQKAFMIVWGRATSWNGYLAAFVPGIFIGIGVLIFIAHALKTRPELTTAQRALLCGILSLLFFTLNQYENLIWSFQFGWGLLFFALVAFDWAFRRYVETGREFITLVALLVLASFSLSQGLALCFFVLLVGMLAVVTKEELALNYFWLCAEAAAVIVAYFIDYKRSSAPTNGLISTVLSAPKDAALYFFALAGTPFSLRLGYAQLAGFLITLAFLLGIAWTARERRFLAVWDLFTRYPLVPISGVILLVITVGRLPMGIQTATASRYVTCSVLVAASVGLYLLDLVRRQWGWLVTPAMVTVLCLSIPVWVVSYLRTEPHASARRAQAIAFRDCILGNGSNGDSCDGSQVYPVKELLPPRVRILREKKLSFFGE